MPIDNAMKNTLQNIYDEFAATYEENRGLFDMSEVLDSFYSALALENGKLLDLGCGAGEPVASYFIKHDWSAVGVDFSKNMLELASKYVPEMQTIYSNISEVEFEENAFDAVTACYSLFHLPANSHLDLFKKIVCWLRPNGKLLFTYATKEYTGSEEFDGYKTFMGRELYYSHKTPEDLYADLIAAGFSIDSTVYRDIGNEVFLWVTVSKRPVEANQ